jgi:hypothetical protein
LGSTWQSVTFRAIASGKLTVTGGTFSPDQPVDSYPANNHYELGKLHHLPLGNTTSRNVINGTNITAGWNGPYTVAGLYGIPVGAKAVRLKCRWYQTAALTNTTVSAAIAFSDNNSNTPSINTSHPVVEVAAEVVSYLTTTQEIDIPLNSAGQFYIYGYGYVGQTAGSPQLYCSVIGYYMGD